MKTVIVLIVLVLGAAGASDPAQSVADYAAQRVAMMASIHATIRAAAPSADDAYLARTLAAMSQIPREKFVPPGSQRDAYREIPLSIGYDQTISDAYIVAVMTAAARVPEHANVLDVGTGSGYQAAVLARLADHVSSIEIVQPLAEQATRRLADMGYANVDVRAGDGYVGWTEHAPFDAIIVAAGGATVPQPLLDQLKPGGRLVMPIGPSWAQEQILVLTKMSDGRILHCSLGWSMFVPLTGRGSRPARLSGLFDTRVPLCYGRAVARADFQAPAEQ
nr:protein-L-isoaspartate(D-aspartate) O-methyltransferase [uncultured Sphingomonas sp.]